MEIYHADTGEARELPRGQAADVMGMGGHNLSGAEMARRTRAESAKQSKEKHEATKEKGAARRKQERDKEHEKKLRASGATKDWTPDQIKSSAKEWTEKESGDAKVSTHSFGGHCKRIAEGQGGAS